MLFRSSGSSTLYDLARATRAPHVLSGHRRERLEGHALRDAARARRAAGDADRALRSRGDRRRRSRQRFWYVPCRRPPADARPRRRLDHHLHGQQLQRDLADDAGWPAARRPTSCSPTPTRLPSTDSTSGSAAAILGADLRRDRRCSPAGCSFSSTATRAVAARGGRGCPRIAQLIAAVSRAHRRSPFLWILSTSFKASRSSPATTRRPAAAPAAPDNYMPASSGRPRTSGASC